MSGFITLSTGEIIKKSQLNRRNLVLIPEGDGGYVAYYNELPEAISEGGTYEETMSCLDIAVNAVTEYHKKELLKSLCLN